MKKPSGFELWEGKRYIHGEACAERPLSESTVSTA